MRQGRDHERRNKVFVWAEHKWQASWNQADMPTLECVNALLGPDLAGWVHRPCATAPSMHRAISFRFGHPTTSQCSPPVIACTKTSLPGSLPCAGDHRPSPARGQSSRLSWLVTSSSRPRISLALLRQSKSLQRKSKKKDQKKKKKNIWWQHIKVVSGGQPEEIQTERVLPREIHSQLNSLCNGTCPLQKTPV